LLRSIMTAGNSVVTRGTTFENRAFLSASFLDEVKRRYEGTRLGRQELEAEILDDVPGALWSRALIEACRVREAPALLRIVVAVDPPASRSGTCGIVAAGLAEDGVAYVLADCSLEGGSPLDWGREAVAAFHRFDADRLVAEINQGGDMVETILRQVDETIPFRAVRATRGKGVRAEPVAALYEQGRVRHAGAFAALEDQLCLLGADFDAGREGFSPDRADALVWALTELMLGGVREPGIRRLS
jgi:phage terminase large subunit-like protein